MGIILTRGLSAWGAGAEWGTRAREVTAPPPRAQTRAPSLQRRSETSGIREPHLGNPRPLRKKGPAAPSPVDTPARAVGWGTLTRWPRTSSDSCGPQRPNPVSACALGVLSQLEMRPQRRAERGRCVPRATAPPPGGRGGRTRFGGGRREPAMGTGIPGGSDTKSGNQPVPQGKEGPGGDAAGRARGVS